MASYESDWRAFEKWCVSAGRQALPADGETVALYVTARIEGGLRVSSAERHVAAVAYEHRMKGLPIPAREEARAVMTGARRQRHEQPRRRAAISPTELRRICRKLASSGTQAAARDQALLTIGFATGLRRSNLVALDVADVRFVPRRGVVVSVRSSKTDQFGRGHAIGVRPGRREETCPVRALRGWLKVRGEEAGPLFTPVAPTGPVFRRLNPESVNELVKSAVRLIGLDAANYGAHSLRAGLVTAADNAGASTLAIMERTGHKSVEMVERYRRNRDPFAGADPLAGVL